MEKLYLFNVYTFCKSLCVNNVVSPHGLPWGPHIYFMFIWSKFNVVGLVSENVWNKYETGRHVLMFRSLVRNFKKMCSCCNTTVYMMSVQQLLYVQHLLAYCSIKYIKSYTIMKIWYNYVIFSIHSSSEILLIVCFFIKSFQILYLMFPFLRQSKKNYDTHTAIFIRHEHANLYP